MKWFLIAILLSAVVAPILAQGDQIVVATGFGTVARVFQVSPDGQIIVRQAIDLPAASEQVEIDSGGRFVVFITASDNKASWLYPATDDLSFQAFSEFAAPRPNWDLVSDGSRVVPVSNSIMAYTASPENLARVEIHVALVSNRLEVRYTGDWIDLTATPADGPLDAIASAYDPDSLFVAVSAQEHAQILRLDQEDGLTLTAQGYAGLLTPLTRPSRDATGRLVIFDQQAPNDFGIGRFTGDGMSTFVIADLIDVPGFTNSLSTAMHPSGRWAFSSGSTGVISVELDDMGEFVRVVGDPAPGGGTAMAISSDGRFLFTGSAHLIRVNDDGSLTGLGQVPGIPSLSDIAWIPPRTLPTLPGDANLDGVVDAADVVFLVNEAMPDDKPILLPQYFANADLDGDVDVDEEDLQGLVDLLLER